MSVKQVLTVEEAAKIEQMRNNGQVPAFVLLELTKNELSEVKRMREASIHAARIKGEPNFWPKSVPQELGPGFMGCPY